MNELAKLSAFACGVELLIYWGTVFIKGVRLARKIGKDPNFIPREKTGIYMRLVWTPAVIVWSILPWVALSAGHHSSFWIRPMLPGPVALAGALIGAVAVFMTFFCWHQMGRSWRIGIDPNEKTELVTTGSYRIIRHPIYALSILLTLGTLLAVFTWPMLIAAAINITMLQVEARREEQYLLRKHGEPYAAYCRKVGRFIPRLNGV